MTLRGPPGGDDRGPCGDGVNYAAVLDTAIDVARAMVHLHKQSVSGNGAAHGSGAVCDWLAAQVCPTGSKGKGARVVPWTGEITVQPAVCSIAARRWHVPNTAAGTPALPPLFVCRRRSCTPTSRWGTA